jgi:hypothetical protein
MTGTSLSVTRLLHGLAEPKTYPLVTFIVILPACRLARGGGVDPFSLNGQYEE